MIIYMHFRGGVRESTGKIHTYVSPLLSTLYYTATSPLTPDGLDLHTSSRSATPAQGRTIQLNSDTTYLDLASEPKRARIQSHRAGPPSDASRKNRLSLVLLTNRL